MTVYSDSEKAPKLDARTKHAAFTYKIKKYTAKTIALRAA